MLRPFRILQPETVAEACRELRKYGDAAKVYAGGSELLLLIRHGLIQSDYLVDIKHIPGLGDLSWEGKVLHIGANVTHRQVERSPVVLEHMPVLASTEAQVANVRVRNVGTLGGNLCFADPHSDPGTLLLTFDAQVELKESRRKRSMPLEEFFVGMYETALQPEELLRSIDVPALPVGVRAAYQKVGRFERPSLGVAAAAGRRDGRLANVRLAVGCVGPKPMRLRDLEQKVEGLTLDEAQRVTREAGDYYREVLEPVDDLHGSVAYKTYLTGVLLGRVLAQAVEGNGGSHA